MSMSDDLKTTIFVIIFVGIIACLGRYCDRQVMETKVSPPIIRLSS